MKFVRLLFVLFIISILALCAVSYWIYSSMNSAHAHEKASQTIQIPKGSTPNQIVEKLAAENILPGTLAVQIYLRTFGDASKFQAGDYQFASPITPLQVLKELDRPAQRRTSLFHSRSSPTPTLIARVHR